MTQTTRTKLQLQEELNHEKLVDGLTHALTNAISSSDLSQFSPDQVQQIIAQFVDLFLNFLNQPPAIEDISTVSRSLVERGVSLAAATTILKALNAQVNSANSPDDITSRMSKLADFQLAFLQEMVLCQAQINKQQTPEASPKQLEQQQLSQTLQLQRNRSFNQILALNARLALENSERNLLEDAVVGICQVLNLANVGLFTFSPQDSSWVLLVNSSEENLPYLTSDTLMNQFDAALETDNAIVNYFPHQEDESHYLSISTILKVGTTILGSMNVQTNRLEMHDEEALLILIRTFSQNLAALWHNLHLLQASQQQNRELEGAYGRFIDQIWREEKAWLNATYADGLFQVSRDRSAEMPFSDSDPMNTLPVKVREHSFGQIKLPAGQPITPNTQHFIDAIVREMGDALHNAYLLQTTSTFSTQLEVAAEVSKSATTILDRDQLIEEVVALIHDRFGFYYAGLFLVNSKSKTAVLQSGTGDAGRIQLTQKHNLPIDESSMIGAAIANNQAIVEQDVQQAKSFMRNPHLPDTRSELALPLRKGENVIGALTVQSTERGAFSQTAVTVLQSLADQLAIAIENASLFEQTERTLTKANRLYETSRRISAAPDAAAIHQMLIDFVAESNLFDMAQLIIEDPANPDYFVLSAHWHRYNKDTNISERLPRDHYIASEQLLKKRVLIAKGDFSELDEHSRQLLQSYQLKGVIFVPLHHENEWLGTLAMACINKTSPERDEIQPFLTLAGQASILLSNHQLLKQTASLYSIGRSITQAITRDDALNVAVKEVAQYTGAQQCRFVLYDKQTGTGEVVAEYNTSGMAKNVTLPMLGDFVYDHLNEKHAPMLLEENNPLVPDKAIQLHALQFGAAASMLIPSASQQELIGFLAIDSRQGKRPFKPSNIIFAQTIVDHVTTQIENIKLLDEALSRAQELITLNQIQSNISSVLDTAELSTSVYNQVGRLLDNTIFILAQFDSATNRYTPLFVNHDGQSINIKPRTLLPEEQLYQFLENDTPVVSNSQSPLLLEESERFLDKPPKSALWIPLQQEDHTIGLISVQSYNTYAYSEHDIQLLRSIATQTSLAITNAQLFETIQANNEKLRQLDHLKNQFLANMSHELRTPLNSIIGFSRVILKGIDGPTTPEQQEDLTSIYNNGHHLLTLINEILDMAKIEAGKMALAFSQIDIAEAAQTAVKTIHGIKPANHIQFIWDVPDTLPKIEADPMRIRQIFINLLANAYKYTESGSVQLSIRAAKNHIHAFVKDSGIGISETDHKKIFVAFEQVDNSTTRTAGGTGLGLPITKWIVESHQGQIWFESKVNKGTTFHIRLPLQQAKQNQPTPTNFPSPLSQNAPQSSKTE